MIVKILQGGSTFSGIRYNETKVRQGKARRLYEGNMEGLMITDKQAVDYRTYMKNVSDLNTRVKRKQFHAVISVKGKSRSLEELSSLAQSYLKEMGYANCPVLIYGHLDTKHNHVHIITTRVDLEGNKVNDSYEKRRSVEIIRRLIGKEISKECSEAVAYMNTFKFSTTPQARMLLELQGFKTSMKGNMLHLYKNGRLQESIDVSLQQKKSPNPSLHLKRLLESQKGSSLGQIERELARHSIGIVIHRGKDHDAPYGYTVIDFSRKEIFKGSQLLRLNELLHPKERIAQHKELKHPSNEFISSLIGELLQESKNNDYKKKRTHGKRTRR